jgi:hypothetical protein
MERRELIQWLVATAGLQCLDSLAPEDLLALGRDVHQRATPRALSPHDERIVAAAAARILPDADVTAFIDKMLADWHTPEERARFLAGLPDLDARCRARRGGPRDFVDCSDADQVAVLTELDDQVTALRAAQGPAANQHWFAMLKYLTVYGWCTSEPGMRALGLYPMAGRYDGCAPV